MKVGNLVTELAYIAIIIGATLFFRGVVLESEKKISKLEDVQHTLEKKVTDLTDQLKAAEYEVKYWREKAPQ